jgi:acyl-CoA reductase-like NAD-dependent aldehyde dehydrogenase
MIVNANSRTYFSPVFRLLIGGRLVDGATRSEVINPATEQPVAVCPRADLGQLDQAVAAANAAFPAWAMTPIAERRKLILTLAGALAEHTRELAILLTQEQGKPLVAARQEICAAIAVIRALASLDLPLKVLKDEADNRIVEQRTPLGVVAAITPWNFPLFLLVTKMAPALLAGNTVVVKPAPTTPLTTLRLGELCAHIFPAGVVNAIADLDDLGNALASHPHVAKVAFTGSTATGRKVMAGGVSTFKRLTLELGGNDAALVLDDVDPEEVALKVFYAAMVNSGQVCVAAKRAYVHVSMYDTFCAELGRLADSAIVGSGLDAATQFGPLQNKEQYERVQGYIQEARGRGTILAGGSPVKGPGYFIRPTIVRDIPDDTRLVQEEQFGPVLPVLSYSTLEDAIVRVNSTEYSLGATVWSANADRAFEVALRINSGMVWVNKQVEMPPDVPMGGAKQSGLGTEMGLQALEPFTQAKIINMARQVF